MCSVSQIDESGKLVFDFERIEGDLIGLKLPLPSFTREEGFVEAQVWGD